MYYCYVHVHHGFHNSTMHTLKFENIRAYGMYVCNTFTPQIKEQSQCINVILLLIQMLTL